RWYRDYRYSSGQRRNGNMARAPRRCVVRQRDMDIWRHVVRHPQQTQAEIARIFGVAESTVTKALQRAERRLQEKFTVEAVRVKGQQAEALMNAALRCLEEFERSCQPAVTRVTGNATYDAREGAVVPLPDKVTVAQQAGNPALLAQFRGCLAD